MPLLVDLLFIVVFVIIVRGALDNASYGEAVYVLNVLIATFITLHFYPGFSKFLGTKVLFESSERDVVAYLLLAVITCSIYPLTREGWLYLLNIRGKKIEANRIICGLLAALRAYMICGLIFLGLLLCHNDFLQASARGAFSSAVFRPVSVNIYQAVYFGGLSKIFPSEPLNHSVIEVVSHEGGSASEN